MLHCLGVPFQSRNSIGSVMHLLGEQSTRVCTQAAANNSLCIALKDCLKNSSNRDTSAVGQSVLCLMAGHKKVQLEIWLVVEMWLDNIHATDGNSLLHTALWHHKVKSPVFIALHGRGELLYIVVWAVLVGKSESQLR